MSEEVILSVIRGYSMGRSKSALVLGNDTVHTVNEFGEHHTIDLSGDAHMILRPGQDSVEIRRGPDGYILSTKQGFNEVPEDRLVNDLKNEIARLKEECHRRDVRSDSRFNRMAIRSQFNLLKPERSKGSHGFMDAIRREYQAPERDILVLPILHLLEPGTMNLNLLNAEYSGTVFICQQIIYLLSIRRDSSLRLDDIIHEIEEDGTHHSVRVMNSLLALVHSGVVHSFPDIESEELKDLMWKELEIDLYQLEFSWGSQFCNAPV